MTPQPFDLNKQLEITHIPFVHLRKEIHKVIIGQSHLIDRLLIALLVNGHVLIEGLPGIAKTLTISTLAKAICCECKRIQFTPDLLPADLTGTAIYNPQKSIFQIKKGPLFAQIVIADELNRAPAKVQSALLEAMAERHITIQGQTFDLPFPFIVLATQNPIEQEGTYPLSEAQNDRFMMKLLMSYPSMEEERQIIHRMSSLSQVPTVDPILKMEDLVAARTVIDAIYVDEKVIQYVLDIIFATRNPHYLQQSLDYTIRQGASPRASLALILAAKAHAFLQARAYVTPNDVHAVAHEILRHRVHLSYESMLDEHATELAIDRILHSVTAP